MEHPSSEDEEDALDGDYVAPDMSASDASDDDEGDEEEESADEGAKPVDKGKVSTPSAAPLGVVNTRRVVRRTGPTAAVAGRPRREQRNGLLGPRCVRA